MSDFDSAEYRYRPWSLTAQAVQLTLENAAEVAEWCGGLVTEMLPSHEWAEVKVPCWDVTRPAHPGNWVVKESDAFEVYDTEEFREHYRAIHLPPATDWPQEDPPKPAVGAETGL